MKNLKFRLVSLCVVFLISITSAQINLHCFNSQSVRDFKWAPTSVDSVLVETEVGNGLAKTSLTMTLTPGAYQEQVYDAVLGTYTLSGQEELLDSIEISSWFVLPTDFVVSDMYLWIDGVRKRAEIQDRSLAREQYEETVNRRIDPALVEFFGNGSYSVRMFPAQSYSSRKIEIVFNHTFDDDSLDFITASIPLAFDSMCLYYYYYEPFEKAHIGYMRAALRSVDGGTYQFSMPGLGDGGFSSRELVLENSNISTLLHGTISCRDPSVEKEYMWAGTDKYNRIASGFSVMLDESSVELEPEPQTRIIVVDVREEWWDWDEYNTAQQEFAFSTYPGGVPYRPTDENSINIWNRARKFAIASIQSYVDEDQKFNIVFAGREPQALFDAPVYPTKENLAAAYNAILSARPDPEASTIDAIDEAISQSEGEIVILISDLYRPYNYERYLYDAGGLYVGAEKSADGAAFDALISDLSEMVVSSGITLFTIVDEWGLNDIAVNSGGFNLSYLRYDWCYLLSAVESADGKVEYRSALPRLFLDNYYRRGITGIEISCGSVENITWTLDGYGYYWWWRGGMGIEPMMVDDVVMAKKVAVAKGSGLALPGYQDDVNRALLRVAGTARSMMFSLSDPVFTVTGKMGGLKFTKTVRCARQSVNRTGDNVQWAFRKSEHLAGDDWYNNEQAVKTLGYDYHIVTRQTSLLALEDGMELWEDTLAPESGARGEDMQASVASDASNELYYNNSGTGINIDDITVEDLINGYESAVLPEINKTARSFAFIIRNSVISLTVPRSYEGLGITLKLFDLRGRLVASKNIEPVRNNGDPVVWSLKPDGGALSNLFYILKVSVGDAVKMFKVPIVK